VYIERDAKIIMIYRSVIGIVVFIAIYIAMMSNQQSFPNRNFEVVQLMIMGIVLILTAILVGSAISLKREVSRQQNYLESLPEKPTALFDQTIALPYNKMGLYSILIASLLGVFAFVYLYYSLVIVQPMQSSARSTNLDEISLMIIIFISVFMIIFIGAFFVLLRRIQTPLYDHVKVCPRCGSGDVHKIDYSWWGGLIGPSLVHQVRCKQCGKTYEGVTGTTITKKVSTYFLVMIIISIILVIIRLLI
jgi:hypothetical protein